MRVGEIAGHGEKREKERNPMSDMRGIDATENTSILDDALYSAETTVLGIGNVILRDEGLGVRVVEYLDARYEFPDSVQLVDGGTLGIELTQYVTGTRRLLVIDSINGGREPGTLFTIRGADVMAHFQDKLSAHEVGIQDLLALLSVTGREIPEIAVVGAQPYEVEAGVGLTEPMMKVFPRVADRAMDILKSWGIQPKERAQRKDLDFTSVAEGISKS